ncbi:hypothetical protein BOX15_Mlig031423g1 [Macrostomum lignano]|uniref:Major facilitator superfamily (MFS) profile domain-containing protein n=1 Tax=Macrostomum lignano TaxID=282301 RepID=A0A267H6G9_9PLAT|nr:hypothetical protein BOX15_Mlig031423g1 [Macrostomum lignano]
MHGTQFASDDNSNDYNGLINGNVSGQILLPVSSGSRSNRNASTTNISANLPSRASSANNNDDVFVKHHRSVVQQEGIEPAQVQAVSNPIYVNLDIKVEDADQTAVESACGSSSSDESSIFVPFSFRALSRKRKLLLVSLCLGELCSNVMLSIMAPFFPSEAEAKGVSSTVSGWIFGVLPLAQVIFSPIVGAMMKPAGVKFLFLSGAFLGGCATILFGALDHMPSRDGGLMFIIYCFAIRITTAWGFASYTTAAFVIIAQEFGDNVSQVFGIAETFCGIGAVLGPAVGGVLYGWGGFGLPFFVLGGIYLLTVPLSWPLIPSDAESHHGQVSNFTLLRVPGILMMCWTVIVLGTGWSIFEPVLEPRLGSYNLSPQLIGLVFLLTAASYALSAPLFGWITERINDLNPLILASLAGCTACLAMLGPSPLFTNNAPDSATGSLALIIVSLALLGLFNSMGIVPSYEYMLDAAEEAGLPDDVSVHGAIGGLWGSAYAFGEFVGPIAGGFLVDISSFGWATTAGAGLSLISVMRLCTGCLFFVLLFRTGTNFS